MTAELKMSTSIKFPVVRLLIAAIDEVSNFRGGRAPAAALAVPDVALFYCKDLKRLLAPEREHLRFIVFC